MSHDDKKGNLADLYFREMCQELVNAFERPLYGVEDRPERPQVEEWRKEMARKLYDLAMELDPELYWDII